ncbi:hypothetical protein GGX14DRAFT_609726 [Mycena pura]|uniref:Uncharacterized protein n=1 Tax=Mycena pura TaxID=153505 RepID=A0AAD6YJB6_9AGAR|nr:hypothetical protein GGX14DRAFT_609726 [Mycena pura]
MSPMSALATLVLLLVFSALGQASLLPPCKLNCPAPSPTTTAKVACDPAIPGTDCVPAPTHSSSLSTATKATTTETPAASAASQTVTPNTQLIPPPLTGVITVTVPSSIPTLPAFGAVPPALPPFSAAAPPQAGIPPAPAPSISDPLLLSPASSTDPALLGGSGSGTALPPSPSAAAAAADADPAAQDPAAQAAAPGTAEASGGGGGAAQLGSTGVSAVPGAADGATAAPTAFGDPLPSAGLGDGGAAASALPSAISGSGAAGRTSVHLVGVASAVFAVAMFL